MTEKISFNRKIIFPNSIPLLRPISTCYKLIYAPFLYIRNSRLCRGIFFWGGDKGTNLGSNGRIYAARPKGPRYWVQGKYKFLCLLGWGVDGSPFPFPPLHAYMPKLFISDKLGPGKRLYFTNMRGGERWSSPPSYFCDF